MKKVAVILVLIIVLGGIIFLVNRSRNGVTNNTDNKNMTAQLTLSSPAFAEGEFIPAKYTCDGLNISPPLTISNIPEGTKSLVLVVDDPDVPKALRPDGVFDHWTLYNIPKDITSLEEGKSYGTSGLNGAGQSKYTGPCPPVEYEPTTHRYNFKVYATDLENLNFVKAPTKDEVLEAIIGHIIEQAELMGKYDKTKNFEDKG